MGIETNTTGQNKALPPAFQFNWSQMESESDRICVPVPASSYRVAFPLFFTTLE